MERNRIPERQAAPSRPTVNPDGTVTRRRTANRAEQHTAPRADGVRRRAPSGPAADGISGGVSPDSLDRRGSGGNRTPSYAQPQFSPSAMNRRPPSAAGTALPYSERIAHNAHMSGSARVPARTPTEKNLGRVQARTSGAPGSGAFPPAKAPSREEYPRMAAHGGSARGSASAAYSQPSAAKDPARQIRRPAPRNAGAYPGGPQTVRPECGANAAGYTRRPKTQQSGPAGRTQPSVSGVQKPGAQRAEAQKPAASKAHPQNRPPRSTTAKGKRGANGWVYPEHGTPYRDYSAEELKRRGMRDPEKYADSLKKRSKMAAVKSFFIRLGISLLAVCIAGGIWYYSGFVAGVGGSHSAVAYSLGSDVSFKLANSAAYEGTVRMIDFTLLADWLGLARVGSAASQRFVVRDAEDEERSWVRFTEGSASAEINGVAISMTATARVDGDSCLVPLDFVKRYMSGVDIATDTGDKVGVSRTVSGEVPKPVKGQKNQDPEYDDVSFRMSSQEPIVPVAQPETPAASGDGAAAASNNSANASNTAEPG